MNRYRLISGIMAAAIIGLFLPFASLAEAPSREVFPPTCTESGYIKVTGTDGSITIEEGEPAKLTVIEDEAFMGVSAEVVVLPEGTESIGDYAFAQSKGLRQVYIPDSVKTIGEHAFDGCSEELVVCGKAGSAAEEFAEAKEMEFREK